MYYPVERPVKMTAERLPCCPQRRSTVTVLLLVAWAAVAFLLNLFFLPLASNTYDIRGRQLNGAPRVKIFSAFVDNSIAQKERRALALSDAVEHVVMTTTQQQEFLMSEPCGEGVLERYNDLLFVGRRLLAQEVWKYCALAVHGGIAIEMLRLLMVTLEEELDDLPIKLAKTLYRLIKEQTSTTLHPGPNGDIWYLFDQKCSTDPNCAANLGDRLK
jgi:hypothetical protein